MIYAYIRVSTDKQTVENQREELKKFAIQKGFIIDEWVEETISGTKKVKDRELGEILNRVQKGDTIIVSELSRIGRKLLEIMSFLNQIMEKEVFLLSAKEGYELGDNINSKVLAFAFGLSAEIERNLISQRTNEAMVRMKARGIKLGRPKGKKSNPKRSSLYGKKEKIQEYLDDGMSVSAIARIFDVHRITLSDYIKKMDSNFEEETEKNKIHRLNECKKQAKQILTGYTKGDVNYLSNNVEKLIKLKNNGYPYSVLSLTLGLTEDTLKSILK